MKSILKDRTSLGHSEKLCYLSNINLVSLEFLFGWNASDQSVIDFYSMRIKPISLFKLGIHIVEDEDMVFRAIFEQSLKHRPCSFDPSSSASMPSNELVNVCQPYFMQAWPFEVGKSELECSESLLEICVLPQKVSVVYQHQRSHTFVLATSLKCSLYCLEVPEVDLKIDVELP